MKIEYPDNFSLDELNSVFLWRYIGLHKLFDLVLNQQIYFSRLDSFEDGIEGLTEKGLHLKLFSQDEPLNYNNINQAFDTAMQKEQIENDKITRSEYLHEFTSSQQSQFASCWFLGNRESLAMWKIYAPKDGVAVKFNARQLTETIIAGAESYTNNDFQILLFGPVEYKNIWPYDPQENFTNKFNALKKDKSYSHESEFRFITVVPGNKKGVYKDFTLPFGDLSTYQVEIVTNPFMSQWEVDNLKKIMHAYGLSDKIKRSQIDIKL